jgi:hypothetical protein
VAYLHAIDNTMHFEQNGNSWPSSVGDSCAETSRAFVLGDLRLEKLDLVNFVAEVGYVRHPSLAKLDGWDYKDFTSDQALPLILGFDHKMPALYWRTAPSKLASPGVMFAARNWWAALGLVNLVQAALFKFVPYRYSDDERLRWFERIVRTDDQYADHLNWFVVVYFLHKKGYHRLVRANVALVDRMDLLRRVNGYYSPEPNSEWIRKLYADASLEAYRE